METTFINTENSKMNKSYKFAINLSQRLDLRSSDKVVALQNLSIYYKWKNIKKQYKKKKPKIKNATVAVPLKYSSIFWRTLEI